MSRPLPFISMSLCGGDLRRGTNMNSDTQQFTVVHPNGSTLMYVHLDKHEASQWAAVLTEYAAATK